MLHSVDVNKIRYLSVFRRALFINRNRNKYSDCIMEVNSVISIVKNAKTDNERLAALLLVFFIIQLFIG